MPFPNEHSCRLSDSGKYDRFARKNCEEKSDGRCLDVIYGIKEGKSEIQALRYPKDVWDESAARSHCGTRDGSFEAAAEGKNTEEIGELKVDPEGELKMMSLSNLKLEANGIFKALFAPFGVIDKGGDWTEPGAFGNQNVVISSYGHGSTLDGRLPVGKGKIYDGEEGGIVEGKFFLNTTGGLDTYNTVKELGELQQWSYYLPVVVSEMGTREGKRVRILKKIQVGEVSPVLRGMGNGTRTLAIKGVLSFAEQMEKVTMSAEDALDRLKGRVAMRESEFHAPKPSDLERAKELKTRLEGLAAKLGEILDQHDAFSAALGRFEKATKGE